MKIAIIGSGISGLTCGYMLHKNHDIHIFEKDDWVGGHTHTVEAEGLAIDTGFIVFNDRNYPNFKKIMDELSVSYRKTEMSFSVRNDSWGLEYNGCNLNTLFAQRRNLFRPKFYKLIIDILRFNKLAKRYKQDNTIKLGEFLKNNNFTKWFSHAYLLPMTSAIWSMGMSESLEFPLAFFVKFFENHGLLQINNRPQWYTIEGGSRNYVTKMIQGFSNKIHLNTQVRSVDRNSSQVHIILADGREMTFDRVIFAAHADQSLRLIKNPTKQEVEILESIKFSKNEVILHKDVTLLPRRKLAYASWNYLMNEDSESCATLTYNMNILQGLTSTNEYCVTLNSTNLIDPQKIIARFNYEHPIYCAETFAAQQRIDEISGQNLSYFCGAYLGYGFHEDGVVSALKVCRNI